MDAICAIGRENGQHEHHHRAGEFGALALNVAAAEPAGFQGERRQCVSKLAVQLFCISSDCLGAGSPQDQPS
jgi:hypothetical protein